VKLATKGVLSRLEITKIVFVFGRGGGSTTDPAGGTYDATFDALHGRRFVGGQGTYPPTF